MFSKHFLIVMLVLLTAYVGMYLYVRQHHWLIHKSGFAFGMTDNHSVIMGDPAHVDVSWRRRSIAYLVFTPLRYVETAYWYVRYPKDEPWPYFQRPTNP